jgi:peroxiredoxin
MPDRISLRAAAAIATLIIFTIWITWRAKSIEMILSHSDEEVNELNGKPAPDFHLPSLDGRTVSPGDFRGQKSLAVTFWASWCGPCREELPQLAAFYRRTHKPDSNYDLVAISIDDNPMAARKAAVDMQLPFPVLLDEVEHTAAGLRPGKISRLYHVNGIPELFLIGKEGRVYHVEVGDDSAAAWTLAEYLGMTRRTP